MIKIICQAMGLFVCLTTLTYAGTLAKEGWAGTECGAQPVPPELNFESVKTFNASVAESNAWQRESVNYFQCIAKEANDDIQKINASVKALENQHNEMVKTINSQAEAYQQYIEEKRLEASGQAPAE